jgi:hypothetical protein
MTDRILYIKNDDIRSVLGASREALFDTERAAAAGRTTADGLLGSVLSYDKQGAMIVLQLAAAVRDQASLAVERTIVYLGHSEDPPTVSAMASAAGVSDGTVRRMLARAEQIPVPDDE